METINKFKEIIEKYIDKQHLNNYYIEESKGEDYYHVWVLRKDNKNPLMMLDVYENKITYTRTIECDFKEKAPRN